MPLPPPPTPKHIIRAHAHPVHTVSLSDDNERIYSGDAHGVVVVSSTRTLRALAAWRAHTDGLLGVQEWAEHLITHGRDNKLHVWRAVGDGGRTRELGGGAAVPPGLDQSAPELCYSMDVNALNYCRFSLLPLAPCRPHPDGDPEALLAVPNLVESAYADVWTLPGRRRLHAAIGRANAGAGHQSSQNENEAGSGPDGRGVLNPIGIIMSMHLSMGPAGRLRLLCGYENGSVTMREYVGARETSVEGRGWDVLWSVKLHVESVMALTVSRDGAFALSVSADHLVGRYELAEAEPPGSLPTSCAAHRTKYPGNAAVSIRDDGRVCAIGGWDGRVRLYSTKTFKPLGTLVYHKKNCQSVVFAHARAQPANTASAEGPAEADAHADDDEDGMSEAEKQDRTRWLVSGGQDGRVAVWALMDFGKVSS